VPELTLALCVSELAGWTSDGDVCGPLFIDAVPAAKRFMTRWSPFSNAYEAGPDLLQTQCGPTRGRRAGGRWRAGSWPGLSPKWLASSRAWGGRKRERVVHVPRSLTDQPGLLVLPEQTTPVGDRIAGGFACAAVAERLFLPVEARLHPPMTEAEVRELCRSGVTFVHPALGVSVFGDEDVRRVWDLLEMPEERVEHWHCARAGDPPLPGLVGIVLDPPPTLAEVFGAAGEDIGSKPLQELPPSPTEPKPGNAAARKLKGTLMKALSGLLRKLPHTGTRRTWVNDLGWAARQLKAWRASSTGSAISGCIVC
jgi:hypothetical protein